MVGFISGDPISSQSIGQLGLDAVPSGLGDAVGSEFTGGFQGSYGPRIARSLTRAGVNPLDPEGIGSGLGGLTGGQDNGGALPGMVSTGPQLAPDEANSKYGIPGVLDFKQPVSDVAAKDLYDAKHAEVLRQDIQNRAPSSFGVRTAASFVGGMMDPTNLALGLIPGVGEAAVTDALGGGLLARAAGRAVQGATAGAAGMAAVEPLNALLDSQEHTDWTMGDALRNVAFGGLLGGGLHTVLGGLARGPAQAVSDRIEAAGSEARETLLQGSLGQMMDDRPVTAGPGLDALEAGKALTELRQWQQQQGRIEEDGGTALQAATVPGAPDVTGQIGAASDRLAALRATADGFRADAARAGEGATRAGMDPATADRLADVEQELTGTIPSARRARLEDERAMLLDGRDTGQDALEAARSGAEQQGLQVATGRADAVADQAEAALQKLRDRDTAARGAVADAQGAADRTFGIQAAQLTSREEVVQALASRTLRRMAGRMGVPLADGEADALAQRVLRQGLDPREAVEGIAGRREGALASEALPGQPGVPASGGDGASYLQDARASAMSDLKDAAMREDPARATISDAADQAAKSPRDSLADVQAHVAELEATSKPAPDPDAPAGPDGKPVEPVAAPDAKPVSSGDPAVDAAQAGVEAAEARASAIQQAAACLIRSGI